MPETDKVEEPQITEEPPRDISQDVPPPVHANDVDDDAEEPQDWKLMAKKAVMPFAVSVIVVFLMGYIGIGGFLTTSDYEANVGEMVTKVDSAVAAVNDVKVSLEGKLDALDQSVNSKIDTGVTNKVNESIASVRQQVADVNGLVSTLNTNVTTLLSDVQSLTTQYSAIAGDVASIEAQITSIESDITALQAEEAAPSSGSAEEDIEVDMGYSSYFYWSSGNATLIDQSLAMMITNNTNIDIEGVEIEIVIVTRGVPLPLQNDLCTVVGGYPLQFNKIHVGNGIMVLRGVTPSYGDGLTIDAGDSEYIYFTVDMGVAAGSEPDSDITLYATATCKDYTEVD